MPLTGEGIHGKLERGLFGSTQIRRLVTRSLMNAVFPRSADPMKIDLVEEAGFKVSAEWEADTGTLTVSGDADGQGLLLPWLEHRPSSRNERVPKGSYLGPIPRGDVCRWVFTGPFSGCHAVTFTNDRGVAFAHVVTGAGAPPVGHQILTILGVLGANCAVRDDVRVRIRGTSLGAVFWTEAEGGWHRRVLHVNTFNNNRVTHVGKRSQVAGIINPPDA